MTHLPELSLQPQWEVTRRPSGIPGGADPTFPSFFSSLQLRILWRRLAQPTIPRDRNLTYQYKIQDKNVSFFAKGMSPAIL